jgi:hypothetical protein
LFTFSEQKRINNISLKIYILKDVMNFFFKRLDIFIKHSNLNDNKITVETGIANGLIGKARKRGSLSQENISKILYRYKNLNARWLLTGEGEMLIQEETPIQSKDTISIYKELLAEKEKKIDELNREIGRLQGKLEQLNKDTFTE